MAASNVAGCAAPDQSAAIPASVDLEKETGEFTAEVVTSPQGVFRFFAAPGPWTLRALSRHGNGDLKVDADRGLNEVCVTVTA